jgi:hypothetical protein
MLLALNGSGHDGPLSSNIECRSAFCNTNRGRPAGFGTKKLYSNINYIKRMDESVNTAAAARLAGDGS